MYKHSMKRTLQIFYEILTLISEHNSVRLTTNLKNDALIMKKKELKYLSDVCTFIYLIKNFSM